MPEKFTDCRSGRLKESINKRVFAGMRGLPQTSFLGSIGLSWYRNSPGGIRTLQEMRETCDRSRCLFPLGPVEVGVDPSQRGDAIAVDHFHKTRRVCDKVFEMILHNSEGQADDVRFSLSLLHGDAVLDLILQGEDVGVTQRLGILEARDRLVARRFLGGWGAGRTVLGS